MASIIPTIAEFDAKVMAMGGYDATANINRMVLEMWYEFNDTDGKVCDGSAMETPAETFFEGCLADEGIFEESLRQHINGFDAVSWVEAGMDDLPESFAFYLEEVKKMMGMSEWYMLDDKVMKDGDAESPPDDE